MGFLDTVKGALFTDEGQPKAAAPAPTASGPMNTMTVGGQPAATASNEYVDALRAGLRQRQTAFTSLLAAAETFSDVIPDTTMRLKAAFKMVATGGRSVRDILNAIDIHVSDLDGQRMQFEAALKAEQQKTIGNMEGELSTLKSSTESATAAIQSLQQQMQSLNETIARNATRTNELNGQLASEKVRIGSVTQQFDAALGLVKSDLANQKAVIQSALSA
jgi:chromosome segregation ATPase